MYGYFIGPVSILSEGLFNTYPTPCLTHIMIQHIPMR